MENEYYTPTINEFHIGFECEYLGFDLDIFDKDGTTEHWIKTIISDRDYNYDRDGEYDKSNPLEIGDGKRF